MWIRLPRNKLYREKGTKNKAAMRKGKKENIYVEYFEREREEVRELRKDRHGGLKVEKASHRKQLIKHNAANGQGC